MVSVEEAKEIRKELNEIYGTSGCFGEIEEEVRKEMGLPRAGNGWKVKKPRKVRTGRWNSIGITDKERVRIMNKVRMRCYVMLSQLYKEEYKDLVNEERNKEYEKLEQEFEKNVENIEKVPQNL